MRLIIKKFLFLLCLGHFINHVSLKESSDDKSCFCNFSGLLEDCVCTANTVDEFNSKLHPLLLKLLESDYFRYFQVDFSAPCKWGWDVQCTSPNCAVDTCNEKDVPEEVRNGSDNISKEKFSYSGYGHYYLKKLFQLIPYLEMVYVAFIELLVNWNLMSNSNLKSCTSHDPYPEYHDVIVQDQQFCKLDPLSSPEKCAYVDLIANPEKFTGYSGEAAHKVWNTIYNELCFHPETEDKTLYLNSDTAKTMCLEKRAFYKLVSGLHSSISVHLCSRYLLEEGGPGKEAVWGKNHQEFINRFAPELTDNEGPERLKNVYFLYLVELRAVQKITPLLESLSVGKEDVDISSTLRNHILEIGEQIDSFSFHFDETELFKDETNENQDILEAYKNNFMQISEMMDCLGCERCKVWGKLQVTGIGTALKVLLTPMNDLSLTKHELVALFNALGRHSTSIQELESFRKSDTSS